MADAIKEITECLENRQGYKFKYGKYQIKWLLITPLWIRNNRKTFFKLWAYRILVTLGFLIFIFYILLLSNLNKAI